MLFFNIVFVEYSSVLYSFVFIGLPFYSQLSCGFNHMAFSLFNRISVEKFASLKYHFLLTPLTASASNGLSGHECFG